jgi:AAA-like domain
MIWRSSLDNDIYLYLYKKMIMQEAIRYFNTSGPNIRAEHYTLERKNLIAKGLDLVHKKRYFTIWAPRQTGKSTYFRFLAEELQKEGYKVAHINVENFQNTTEDFVCDFISRQLTKQWKMPISAPSFAHLYDVFNNIADEKCVFIIDEIEGLNTALFGQFLHTIRNAYHSREFHGLKSVILVGVSNITGVVQDNASPFNISESLQIDYFTKEEVFELLGQHETETGQKFDLSVKEKIYAITAGQPGLVNGFGFKLTDSFRHKPVIEYLDYLIVEDWYLYKALDKNVANVINRAKTHQSFLEELLFLERKKRFDIDKQGVRFFHVNGLIRDDADGNIIFWVPLYKKRLQKYFYPAMNGEAENIQNDIWLDNYLTADKKVNFDKIIRNYQAYAQKRGFRYFIEYDEDDKPKGLREAALMYSFETYIQAFLLAVEGKSYLEAHVALGRSDLIVNIEGDELVIESKVFYDWVRFQKGKTQLAYYTKSLGLVKGIYLVFVNKEVTNPHVLEDEEIIDGVTISTYIVRYDVDIDFSDPNRAKGVRKKKNKPQ